ncbi:MAG TPA: alanine--tRNA ligase, partial [Oligoflexia bacterium]|nr:alanine--tRNA ligase [Oligoflexia bacterium]
MKTSEIREAFLKYFEGKGHARIESSSLIPAGDPTLLFTNAGMVQFKDTFLGLEKRSYSRATTCQKCLRISGKHNDLENVGRTARHHTFFEMLGNFSFGDYFKQDAIKFAWEFVTEVIALPKKRLWVTVYEKDDEAAGLWCANTDIPPERVLRRGLKDNFWAMGETGPCGPCSEIFYYLGDDEAVQSAEELLADSTLYLEIWNLVFMQFNRDAQGNMTPLPKPSVDTGMGLERVAAIKQGMLANYDSDLLRAIIAAVEELSAKRYNGQSYEPSADAQYAADVALRVAADHARACAFLVADGIMPSSDGRGYVLRRLIRRACRHGRVLGLKQAFLYKVAAHVVSLMGEAYPELKRSKEQIAKIVRAEEEKFLATLETGLGILEKEARATAEKSTRIFPGTTAFLLHDTYGFPLDLTEDILQSYNLTVDHDAFSEAMEAQRERSRSARASETAQILQRAVKPLPTVFRGYEYTEYESKVLGLFDASGEITAAREGQEIALVAEETPFYGESGGQVGDTGTISSNNAALDVIDTQKTGGDTIVHICRVLDGELTAGTPIRLAVDVNRRDKIRAHHSATHLLHLALREA